jgi:Protein of unknown function, DUF547
MITNRRLWWLVLAGCLCGCQPNSAVQPKPPNEPVLSFSNDDWGKVLAKVATPDGYVRWDVLQSDQETRDALSKYVGLLSVVSPLHQPSLFPDRSDAKAYWINAYNALSIYWVIQHGYPGTIPNQRPDRFAVGGNPMRLAEIDALLQSKFKDRMVSFALNGSAHSDPPLRDTPYDGAVLDAQLVDQAHRYLSDPRGVRREGNTIYLAMPLLAFVPGAAQTSPTGITVRDLAALLPYAQSDSPLQNLSDVSSVQFDFDSSLNRPPR